MNHDEWGLRWYQSCYFIVQNSGNLMKWIFMLPFKGVS